MIHTNTTAAAGLAGVVRPVADGSASDVRRPTPGIVHAARAILVVQGIVVLAAGFALRSTPDPRIPAALAIVSIVEGAIRILLGATLVRSRVLRKIAIVLCAISAVVGFASGGLGILGGLLGVAVVRCLCSEDAKRHFGV